MRFTSHLLLAATLLLVAAPIAMADSIQLTVNSSLLANVSSPNDSYWGGLYNVSPGPPSFDDPTIRSGASILFSNISVFVPDGSLITSAAMNITVPTYVNQVGTATLVAEQEFGALVDPSIPSVAPIFFPGNVSVGIEDALYNHGVIINGNEISTDVQYLFLDLDGAILPNGWSGGTNWAGYVGGYGQVDIPYTVELDVTYTPAPVPEPSSIVLLGTGILGLTGIAWRKILSQS